MERQKRIYRNRQNRNRMFCVGMLAVAALVVLSGLLSGNTGDDFDLLAIEIKIVADFKGAHHVPPQFCVC